MPNPTLSHRCFGRRGGAMALLLAIATGVAAGQSPPPSSSAAPEDPKAALVTAIEPLADHKSDYVKSYAKAAAEVLARHHVPLPAKLSEIVLSGGHQAALTDADLRAVWEQTDKVLRLCRLSLPSPSLDALPQPLAIDLLGCIVQSCPSSFARMEAAILMSDLAKRDLGQNRSNAVTALAASDALRGALYNCFDHAHCAWITADDVLALQTAQNFNLLKDYIFLKALAMKDATAQSLDQSLDEISETLTNASAGNENPSSSGAQQAVDALAAQLKDCRASCGPILAFVQAYKEILALTKSFLAAVNAEDREAAAKCLTPKTAAELDKLPSLRQGIAGAEDVKQIQFQSISTPTITDSLYVVDVKLALVNSRAVVTDASATFIFTKTDAGWRIGRP